MGNFGKQMALIWGKLGVAQKATAFFILIAVAVALAVLVQVSRRPSYELLYSDLDEKDMAQVVTYLKESKVPYQITGGGRAVMVAEGSKYDMRIGLANKGVMPGNRVGLELWDVPGWGASPVAEQMMKRRAIQGELARTIMHIEQVAWADVQIAQAEQSLFAEDRRATTAAITLKLHSGRTLTSAQVAGICRLVAGSIEGLDPKNVTIIDEQGTLLTTPRSDPGSAAAADAHNYRRAFEEHLAGKAQAMLDRALGAGRSVVKVSATLDMDQATETREEMNPAQRVARNEKILSKTTTGAAGEGGAGGGGQSEEVNETSYDVPKTVRTVQTSPGKIKRLDVAVVVDPELPPGKDGKDAALSAKQLEELGMLVKRAVGFDDTSLRKDTFQLTAMSFPKRVETTPAATTAAAPVTPPYMQYVRYGSSVGAVVIFVAFAWFALKRATRAPSVSGAGPGAAPASLDIELMNLGGGNGNGNGHGHAQLRNRVKDLMARDPATAARLLQRWISEDDSRKGKG
jgi:flagellar M-ring protein FliF